MGSTGTYWSITLCPSIIAEKHIDRPWWVDLNGVDNLLSRLCVILNRKPWASFGSKGVPDDLTILAGGRLGGKRKQCLKDIREDHQVIDENGSSLPMGLMEKAVIESCRKKSKGPIGKKKRETESHADCSLGVSR